jgi:hypothetical protein
MLTSEEASRETLKACLRCARCWARDRLALDKTRRAIIDKYVDAAADYQNRFVMAFANGALQNLETTLRSASDEEAKEDYAGAVISEVIGSGVDYAVGKAAKAAGVDELVGPVKGVVKAVQDESKRAAAASASLSAADWIKTMRASLIDSYTVSSNKQTIRKSTYDLYQSLKDGGDDEAMQQFIDQLSYWTSSIEENPLVPSVGDAELSLYEAWLNQHFNSCGGIPGTPGAILVSYDGATLKQVLVQGPFGDQIETGIKRLLAYKSITTLDVRKQICRWDSYEASVGTTWDCACLSRANEPQGHMVYPESEAWFRSTDWANTGLTFRR